MNTRSISRLVGKQPRRLIGSVAAVAGVVTTLGILSACSGGPVHGFIKINCAGGPSIGCSYQGGIVVPISNIAKASTETLTSLSYHGVFSTENVVMKNGTYTGVLAVYDQNNNKLASLNVSYYISGDTAYVSNPSAVNAWVQAHNGTGRHFVASDENVPYTVTNPGAGGGQVTLTTYVNSQPVASSTSHFKLPGGGVCRPPVCDPEPNTGDGK